MKTERRNHIRIIEENRAVIRYIAEDMDSGKSKEIFTLTKDISKGGARVFTDVIFSVGTVFKITVVLSRSKEIVEFYGKVKWVRNLYDGELFEMGVKFMDKISDSVLSLIKHVDRIERGISSTVIWYPDKG
jgi:hypothetical protein